MARLYFNIILSLGFVLVFVIGLIVYSTRQKNRVNKSWFLTCIFTSVWSLFYLLTINSEIKEWAILLIKLVHIFGLLVLLSWLRFVRIFTAAESKNKVAYYTSYFLSLVVAVLSISPFFARDLVPKFYFNYYIDPSFGYYIYLLYFLLVLGYGLILLISAHANASGIKKYQIRYILIASVVGFIGGASTFLPSFGVNVPPYMFIFFTTFPLAIAFGIVRYRLMDTRTVVFRSISFGIVIFVLIAIYVALSTFLGNILINLIRIKSKVFSDIIISTMVSLLIVFGYSPLLKLIEKITEKFLFKKTYDPDKLLASVTEVTSSILDLLQLLKSLSKVMGDAFHYEKFGITLLDEKNKMEIFYKEGFKPAVAEGLVSYKGVTEALYKELEQVSGLLVIDEMKTRFENGEFAPADPVLLNLLHENDIAVIVPLYVKDRLIGIFAVGNKKSGDSYSTQDLGILRIIAGQAGIAIENARLYEELKTFNIKLEQEVRRKTMQLRRANTDLKQLDKAKSEFISIASHQLRTPLTIIKGYISMMQEGSFGAVPVPIADNLKKVFISNERLIQLVEDLLDISRIESGRQEFNWAKIRMENLAQTVVDNLMQNAGAKNLKLAFHKPEKPTPEVVADENKLHEVMMNFVDNAIKYTPSGQIDVFVRVDKGDVVTFCVKDTGKGITSELQDVLFKKFSRGKDSFRSHTEGLGLGLYVAKLMMEAHKGKIWAESDGENKGASFCFSIPVKGVELKAGATSQANLIKPPTAKLVATPPAIASSSK